MARPVRIEFAGGLYHVTARGNARKDIYVDDDDGIVFFQLLQKICTRYDWYCHAYCLKTNHYHLECIVMSDAFFLFCKAYQ